MRLRGGTGSIAAEMMAHEVPHRRTAPACRSDERIVAFGMSATLTIELDSDVLRAAERGGSTSHHVPGVVALQLRVMALNWQESRTGRTPVTDQLRGSVTLPTDFDERAVLAEEMQKKHGNPG